MARLFQSHAPASVISHVPYVFFYDNPLRIAGVFLNDMPCGFDRKLASSWSNVLAG